MTEGSVLSNCCGLEARDAALEGVLELVEAVEVPGVLPAVGDDLEHELGTVVLDAGAPLFVGGGDDMAEAVVLVPAPAVRVQ